MYTLFYNARLVDANMDTSGAILVKGGVIEKVWQDISPNAEYSAYLNDANANIQKIDVQGNVLMPSFIDMHCHMRYPGQSEKEDMQSCLAAAVAGGFGTLVLMPNTNPPVSDAKLAQSIQDEAAALGLADVIQSLTITRGFLGADTTHIDSLEGFPIVTEDGRDVESAAIILEAMEKCAKKGIIVGCHSEDASLTLPAKALRAKAIEFLRPHPAHEWAKLTNDELKTNQSQIDENLQKANRYLAIAEDIATERNIALAERAECKIHIDHVSTKNAIETIRRWKKILPSSLTCEITPHHFALTSDTPGFLRYIVNPPLRSEIDRQALLDALADGTADAIATDHAPHTKSDKALGSPGFSGLETAFGAACTALVHTKKITLNRLSALLSRNPALILGLPKKGLLQAQNEANFIIANPTHKWIVESSTFKTKGNVCPFEGQKFTGKILETWYKGKKVY